MQHIPLLYPFWGNTLDPKKTNSQHALFERHGFDTNFYSITDDISVADLLLMPYSHSIALRYAPDILAACIRESERQGKMLLIDGSGDIEYPVAAPHAIVLRQGGYRFLRKPNEIHIPFYAEDLLEVYCGGKLSLRTKREKAIVGFDGWSSLTPMQEARTLIKEIPIRVRSIFDDRYGACRKGVFFRRDALSILRHSSLIENNFFARRSYSGHTETASNAPERLRAAFVNSLLESDYGLDVRGDANASRRLFEILSLGRIPVIVDTERNFPFSDKINYASSALIVDFRDLNHLPERIAEFHKNISPERFGQMQRNARNAYRTYFRTDALTRALIESLWQFVDQHRRSE
jgi:hypothetical protein